MKLALLIIMAPAWLSASTDQAWRDWKRLSDRQCPQRHVDWVCGDCYLNLIEGFHSILGQSQKRNVDRIADIKRQCATEQMGFGCETGRSLVAYKKLGLMPQFVRYGCRTVKCEYAASCSRLPPNP